MTTSESSSAGFSAARPLPIDRNSTAALAARREKLSHSDDRQASLNKKVSAAKNPEPAPEPYDPQVAREAQAKKAADLAKALDETLKRISRFFRPEDIGNPPGPREIQLRALDQSDPKRSEELARKRVDRVKEELARPKEVDSPLDVLI